MCRFSIGLRWETEDFSVKNPDFSNSRFFLSFALFLVSCIDDKKNAYIDLSGAYSCFVLALLGLGWLHFDDLHPHGPIVDDHDDNEMMTSMVLSFSNFALCLTVKDDG